jgi:transmembrane sensor
MDTMQQAADLLFRKLQGTLDPAGEAALEQWLLSQPAESRQFYTSATEWPAIEAALRRFYQIDETAALKDVWQRIHKDNPTVSPSTIRFRWIRWAAAAAVILLVVGAGATWLINRKHTINSTNLPLAARYKSDALPGGARATLELSDGSVLVLDSAAKGEVARQGDALVRKDHDGALLYEATGKQETTITYNRITTPRGGEYQVTLPDGTRVWLNAASSLRYPTTFKGKERTVELSGEAYFEVSSASGQPFRVTVATAQQTPMQIDVLGTSFDIKAYAGEPARTATLVHGKIKVTNGAEQTILAPLQQARLSENSNRIAVLKPDIDAVLAWKAGLFYLEDASITDVMREISRWYDVDIVYNGQISRQFVGKIPRNMPLMDVLKILESTGWVHFQVAGKVITVTP